MTSKYSIELMLQPPLTCIIPFTDIQQFCHLIIKNSPNGFGNPFLNFQQILMT
jgi:hypothetical protein